MKELKTLLTINESTPLQTEKKDERKKETKYETTVIHHDSKKYEREEKYLSYCVTACCIFMASLIPIAEIIILIIYFARDNMMLLCRLQIQWTYFILSKLIFEIAVVLIIALCSLNEYKKWLYVVAAIAFLCLLLWDIALTIVLLNNHYAETYDINYDTNSEKSCETLIDFILFEVVSVSALILITSCIVCWMLGHNIIVSIITAIAHIAHHLVINADFCIMYQCIMSLVEVIFLAIYYDDYGSCNPLYAKYILSKLAITIIIIACNMFIKCWSRTKIFDVIYIIVLSIWCITASVMFWGTEYPLNDDIEMIECRTNTYTEHYFDFMMLDIVLGFVVVTKVFCSAFWVQLSNVLGSPKMVERYDEFAKSNTAEWLRYKDTH